jgi:ribosomal protein S18 acetylase RimI-like enzyme
MEFRSDCLRCHGALTDDGPAYHCAQDCTYCASCARTIRFVCPNCGGEVVRRPHRAPLGPGASPPEPAPASEVTVRRVGVEALDAIAPLFDAYRQFYEQAPDPAGARRFLADRLGQEESIVLLAEEGGRPVGFVQLYPTFSSVSLGPVQILNDLFVDPSARRRGVGRALLDAARAEGLAADAHYLELSTAVDNPAQRLYEACGWTLDREFLHYELLPPKGPSP